MKLIIDIPKEVKEAFNKADDINFCFYDYNSMIGKAIQNGIPLDNLRAEIEEQKNHRFFDDDDMCIYKAGLIDALEIIDRYRKGEDGTVMAYEGGD